MSFIPFKSVKMFKRQQLYKTTVLSCISHLECLLLLQLLLEKGANVEGGARLSEEKITVTPLQLAAASGTSLVLKESDRQ